MPSLFQTFSYLYRTFSNDLINFEFSNSQNPTAVMSLSKLKIHLSQNTQASITQREIPKPLNASAKRFSRKKGNSIIQTNDPTSRRLFFRSNPEDQYQTKDSKDLPLSYSEKSIMQIIKGTNFIKNPRNKQQNNNSQHLLQNGIMAKESLKVVYLEKQLRAKTQSLLHIQKQYSHIKKSDAAKQKAILQLNGQISCLAKQNKFLRSIITDTKAQVFSLIQNYSRQSQNTLIGSLNIHLITLQKCLKQYFHQLKANHDELLCQMQRELKGRTKTIKILQIKNFTLAKNMSNLKRQLDEKQEEIKRSQRKNKLLVLEVHGATTLKIKLKRTIAELKAQIVQLRGDKCKKNSIDYLLDNESSLSLNLSTVSFTQVNSTDDF